MKPRVTAVVCAALFVALFAARPLPAARVVSISLCENVSQPGSVPINVKDKFLTDAKAIHAVINLAEAKAGSVLKGVWVSIDAIETPNYEIDAAEANVAADGEAAAHFSLSAPDKGWPVGNYRIDIYLDGKQIASAPFSIGENKARKAFEGSGAGEPQGRAAKPGGQPTPAATDKDGGGYTGTYTLKSDKATVTLALQQGDGGVIQGVLFSTTGMQYYVEGALQDGVAVGGCYNDQGGAYFEATLAGNQLSFALIEAGANNMPDYGKARQLNFTRQSSSIDPAIAGTLQQSQTPYGEGEETGAQYSGMPGGQSGTSQLMQQFAGTWVNMTTNTETRVTLAPDGGYYENYEASYSGGSSDGYGNQDMAWGAAGQQQAQGQWRVQGTPEQGVITIMFSNGNTRDIQYRVHVENGETYWNEYWFNGDLYGRQR